MRSVQRSRMMLIMLVLVFALPAMIAKLVLMNGWYQAGVTNRGEWFPPQTYLQNYNQTNPFLNKTWQLVYLQPQDCQALCQQELHLLNQSYQALGKYRQRVTPVVWHQGSPDMPQDAMAHLMMSPELQSLVAPGDFVIVDPLGQVIMKYSHQDQETPLWQLGKNMLADLRKLLKLSRVG